MQAVAKFIEVSDVMATVADNPVVGDMKTPMEELHIILKKIYNKLGP